MFSDMPREVHYNVISNLNGSDRLNLRLTNSSMYSAVTRSDFHLDTIVIQKDYDILMVKYGDDLILNANLKNDEEVQRLLDLKMMLFRRAFASRLVLSLDSSDVNTLNIVNLLLERCVVDSLDYCSFNEEINERLPKQVRLDVSVLWVVDTQPPHEGWTSSVRRPSQVGNFSNTGEITLFTDDSSIDPDLLLTISRPIHIYCLHSNWIEYLGDKVLNELNSCGKLVVEITTPHAFQRIVKTLSSLNNQCTSYTVPYTVIDKIFKVLGITWTDEGLKKEKEIEGVRIISASGINCTLEYEGTHIDIYKTFLKDFPESSWTFHMMNR